MVSNHLVMPSPKRLRWGMILVSVLIVMLCVYLIVIGIEAYLAIPR